MKPLLKKIINGVSKAGLNFVGLGSLMDRNKDGEVDFKDFQWYEFAGAVVILGILIKFEIVDLDAVLQIIESILSYK